MATTTTFWLLAALSVPALPAAAQFCGSEDHGCPLVPNGVASSQGRLFTFEVGGGGGRIAELQGEVSTVLPGVFSGAVRSVADTAAFGLVATGDFGAVSGQPAASGPRRAFRRRGVEPPRQRRRLRRCVGVLGSGSLAQPGSFPTVGLAVPLGTFPVGLTFPTQTIVVEQTPDGPRYAFTNTALVVMG